MARFLRIYWALIRFSVSRTVEFRADFFMRFVMDFVYYGVSISFFKLLFRQAGVLGGWTESQVMVFVAGGLVLDGLFMTLIARNIWEFPTIINRGELDFYLARPYPALLLILLRNFEFTSFFNLLTGLLFLGYTLYALPEPIAPLNFVGFCWLLMNGFILIVCIRLLTVLPVFWTHSQFGFHMLFSALEQVQERPEKIFRGVVHLLFLVVLPLFVIGSYPARCLFGQLAWWELIYAPLSSTIFVLVVMLIWRQGVRSYSSASS